MKQGIVKGWDDPRMPTICGFRRRGYTPEAIRDFCARIGVAKVDSVIDMALLEHCLREDLNQRAARVMAVLRPLKVVITNYAEGRSEDLDAVNNPEDAAMGTRKVPFTREIWIEQDDFREDPPKGYYRLSPGKEVRLRWDIWSLAPRPSRTRRPARSSSCIAPTIRPPAAATLPTAAR